MIEVKILPYLFNFKAFINHTTKEVMNENLYKFTYELWCVETLTKVSLFVWEE